jgi:hypothetical protein
MRAPKETAFIGVWDSTKLVSANAAKISGDLDRLALLRLEGLGLVAGDFYLDEGQELTGRLPGVITVTPIGALFHAWVTEETA